ncbi:MAG: peptidase [Conexibacter sp.]|jgi:D-alanyl-D-alanine carboxypeptidase|nr:peptidase [Conexibacter sp.]
MKRGLTLAALLVLGALPATASATARTDRADATLDRALAKLPALSGGPLGVIATVQRGTQRRVFSHGVSDRSSRRPIDVGDRWRIASVTKAFAGAAALRLVQAGSLSLDDTIAKRLPGLPAAWGQVTLAQAMHHTSGLPDFTTAEAFQTLAISRRPAEPSTLVGLVADRPLVFAPDSRYAYSNTDNVVVGLFVEAATGLSFERVLDQLVLDPLALRHTTMPLGYRMPAPFVHGYANNATGRRDDFSELLNASIIWASGGMTSSPLDLATFIRAYAGGKLFGGATRAAQLRFVAGRSDPPGPGTNAAGLSIFRYRTRCGTVYGHTGNLPGYTTFAASSADGRRSATVQVSTALTVGNGVPATFSAFRKAEELAVCAALA